MSQMYHSCRTMLRHLIIAVVLIAGPRASAQGPYPMTVTTTAPMPPPVTWAELQDQAAQAMVTVNSTLAGTTSVTAQVVVRCQERGIRISTNATTSLSNCTDVEQGTTTFDVEELASGFSGGFSQGDFTFQGITYAEVRDQQMLPSGLWELCVQLLSCGTGEELSGPIPDGCSSWFVAESTPPMFTNICGTTFTLPDGLLNIAWIYMPPPGLTTPVEYRLEIVRIDPEDGRDGDANDAMLSATEPELFLQRYDASPAMIEVPDELMLDAGYRYAVRVTVELEGGSPFNPTVVAQSEVCSFLYQPEGFEGNGTLHAVWPADDDRIPFGFFPIITQFDPYQNYTRFSFHTTLAGNASSWPDRTDDNNWPHGPLIAQRNLIGPHITQEQSTYLPIYHNSAADLGSGRDRFARGERYRWRCVGDFTMGGNTVHGDSGEETFHVGMGPSSRIAPEDDAVLPQGPVTLRWHTADEPAQLTPPHEVMQARLGSWTILNGWVDERWQLEIARDNAFTNVVHTANGTIGGADASFMNAFTDPAGFRAQVYKDLDLNWDASAAAEGTYYWRLHWKTNATDPSSANYNTSEVFRFCVGHCDSAPDESTGTPVDEPPSGECVSVCLADAITNNTPATGLDVGDIVRVGKFNMTVLTVSGSSTYSGTGKIPVRFLNDVNIMVEFSGLQWNSDGRMLKGNVEARHDWNPPSLTTITSGITEIPNMSEADVETMNGLIQDGARLVSLFNSGSEIGMPIGIDREIGDRQVTLGIINMRFDSLRASLDMVAGIDVMEIHTMLSFGIGDMCFTPDGLGDEGRAYLPNDVTVTGDLDTEFRFRGGASTDVSNLTYVDWDCYGFKCLQVACAVKFDRGTVVPEGDHGEAGTDKVEARFKFNVCREAIHSGAVTEWNVMAAFTMDPFEVPGAKDWVFTVEEAWLDWSTIANPEGIDFPEDYDHPTMLEGATHELWKGFYMKRLAMRTPETWGDGTGAPVGASLNNFMIDDQAELSFNFALVNLVAVNQGRIDSWAFSVDSVYMDMLQNNFQRAGLKGRIGLPINGEHDFVKYAAILGYDHDESEFAFTLEAELEDTLTAPLWIAEMELFPESFVRATLSDNSKVRAELHGRIGISTALSSELGIDIGSMPSIRMPGMRFEDLVLDSDDGISCGNCAFAYASPQKEVGGFPLSIRNLALEFDDPTRPALVVEPMVSLSGGEGESSFAASVALKFVTELTLGTGGVERFEFRDVLFTGMHLDVDVSAMRLVGDLRITKTATKEEVKGALSVGFPMGIRGDLQACFGTIKTNPAVPINTSAQHYSYWMVDGMLYFNPGLMIMTGVGIYGFGGGAYHHMRFTEGTLPTNERLQSMAPATPPDEIPPAEANAGADPPDNFTSGLTADASAVGSGPAPSGGRYVEDFNTFLGIRLGLVFGTYPKPDGCNMDLTLRAEFTQAGGLQSLTVRGDIYGLVDIPERDEARITGQIGFSYANREGNEVIHANLEVMLDFVVARGAGAGNKLVDANFHTESASGKWYFIMGTPDNPGGIVVGPPGGPPILSFTNYIMTGNDSIPFQLPDPPARIMEILGLNDPSRGLGTEAATRAAIGGEREMGPLENGAGFAFGASFQTEMDFSLAILYAKFGMAIGFDLLLSEIPESMVCLETGQRPGDNGWYAQGQFYAGLWGELGVQLDLLFMRFRAPILSMSAAMLLQGNFPNPSGFRGRAAVHFSVLNGAITGSANFEVEDGQQCTLMAAGDPLADFQFIKDLGPKGNDVSVFDMPTASYNLPVREVLEVPKVIRPDGSIEMYRFHPYVSSFTLHEVSGNVNVPGSNNFLDDRGTSSYLSRTEALKEFTNYRARVQVGVREEHAPFQLREFVAPGSSTPWREERTQNFRTGAAPDHIPESQVEYTYPVNRQRYFLQQESNNKGRVALTVGVSYLFPVMDPEGSYTYVARFVPLGGGASQETPITYSGGQIIPLTVPTLEPERIHIVQLICRKTATADGLPMINGNFLNGAGIGPGVANLPASVHAAQISAPLTQTFIAANGDVTKLKLTGGNVARATSLAKTDHLLYTFRFRSSKFNTLQEKFAALDLDGRTPARYDDWNNADVRGPADEYFDEADIYGVWKNGVQKLQPLVRFNADFTDNYFRYLEDVMYTAFLQYRTKRTYAFPNNSVTVPAFPMAHWLMWYAKPDPVVSYNGVINGPISNSESENAAAPPNSAPLITMPAGGLFGLPPGVSLPGVFGGGIFNSGGSTSPWHSFGFLYRAGKFAYEDQATIRLAAILALNTPGANGSNLRMLLQTHGPVVNRMNLERGAMQHYTVAQLRHTGNLPTPAQEFPVYYNANYRIKMHFRSPIAGSRNTTSVKPFTLRYEAPPVYNDGTVLY